MHLRNKFIMAPIKLGYSNGDGLVNSKHVHFYEERSSHIGAITLEPLYMDQGLREIPTQLGIDTDNKLPGLKKLIQSIHDNGAKVIAHLSHPGRMANPKIPGNYFISSTDKPCENGGAVPVQMDPEQISVVIKLFVDAAIRAEKAGFDFIELQMGHGYLLAQYLSPEVNGQCDSYGGSLENRMRFPLEVFQAIHSAVQIPIIVRLSGTEMTPDGIKIEETIEIGKILESQGATALHISAGSVCSTPPWFFQHMFIPKGKTWALANRVQAHVKLPIIFVGQINAAADVSKLQKIFGAPYMAIGRALIADPQFVGKLTGRSTGNIKPCLACSEGCLGGVKSGIGLHCIVNPSVGEQPIPHLSLQASKRIAVIGGGLAGMEAAIGLHDRGFSVNLYEKNSLGGQFNLASLPPGKASMARIVEYYVQEIALRKIQVHQTVATSKHLLAQKYDEVVMATGSIPMTPSIDGLTEYYWTEFLDDEQLPSQEKILIIGGGLIGLEVASKLVEKQNKVIIVDLLPELAQDMEMIERTLTLKKLKDHDVQFFLETRVQKVAGDLVYLIGKHAKTISKIDKIVLSIGMRSETNLHNELRSQMPCHLIGDARRVGNAQNAIRDAYEFVQRL